MQPVRIAPSILSADFAKWQLPDAFAFIDQVPRTSVGKFDKKVLRKRLSEGDLEAQDVGTPQKETAKT